MAKDKNEVRYDADGARRVMRAGDYMADLSGQLALGIMANIVGQLTYFYTDKVGLAVGGVGIVMAIAKFIDAFTDVIFGNIVDHSKGGNKKYYQWMLRMAVPAAAIMILMFTVPVSCLRADYKSPFDGGYLYNDRNAVFCCHGSPHQQPE